MSDFGLRAFRLDRARYPRTAWLGSRPIWAVAWFRLGQEVRHRGGLLARLASRAHTTLSLPVQAFTGIELPATVTAGGGLLIFHGQGVTINGNTVIGRDCCMLHGVTLGNQGATAEAPTLGEDVFLGAYAQVLGPIEVGDHAVIGAMSVVLRDVPAGATAVGNPARLLDRGPAPVAPTG